MLTAVPCRSVHLAAHGTSRGHPTLARTQQQQRARQVATNAVAAPTQMTPKIEIISAKEAATDKLEAFTAFNLDDFVAGKSRQWTFWNCAPSTFPWEYSQVEHAIVLEGKFTVQYEGTDDAVEINAGDFVKFPVGKTTFVVKENARKFFTLG